MNSFLPPFRNIPAGVLPESECKGRHFYGYHQTSAHFFYAKKHFFRQKRGGTLIISCAHARRAKGAENGARDERTGGAVRRRTLRKAREYLPQSTRVLPAKYAAALRTATEREGQNKTGLPPDWNKPALYEKPSPALSCRPPAHSTEQPHGFITNTPEVHRASSYGSL